MANDDSYFRELERRFKQTEAPDARAAYLREGERLGLFFPTVFLQQKPEVETLFRVYLPEGTRELTLRPFTYGSSFLDIAYAGAHIHILCHKLAKKGGHVHHRVDADGNITSQPVKAATAPRFLVVKDKLTICSGWDNISLPLLGPYSRPFAHTDRHGYLALQHFSHRHYLLTGTNGFAIKLPYTPSGRTLQEGEIHHVHVTADMVTPIRSDRAKGRVGYRSEPFFGLNPPAHSKLVLGTYISSGNDFESAFNRGSKRDLIEVPRKNLDGLLLALERRSKKSN